MFRIFKNRWFDRWARREGISDQSLISAANEIASGMVDADLGGYLFKKRMARLGGGKRGGYRTIVGYKSTGSERVIFLYAFAKNAKSNISLKEEAALSLVAASFLSAPEKKLDEFLLKGSIVEVKQDE